jgi:hypothetical protein
MVDQEKLKALGEAVAALVETYLEGRGRLAGRLPNGTVVAPLSGPGFDAPWQMWLATSDRTPVGSSSRCEPRNACLATAGLMLFGCATAGTGAARSARLGLRWTIGRPRPTAGSCWKRRSRSATASDRKPSTGSSTPWHATGSSSGERYFDPRRLPGLSRRIVHDHLARGRLSCRLGDLPGGPESGVPHGGALRRAEGDEIDFLAISWRPGGS